MNVPTGASSLMLDDAKASGAVVQNNSWGFDDDLNPDVIKAYMVANPTATLAEALVAYQAITNEGAGDAANDTVNDVGNGAVTWTAADWNAYFDSVKSFQKNKGLSKNQSGLFLFIIYLRNPLNLLQKID